MLEVKNVSKKFEDFTALEDINLQLDRGKVYGIIGENGAGKTTLLQMIAGVYTVEKGEILLDGEVIYDNNIAKNKIAYVADKNQFFRDYTCLEIVDFYESVYEKFSREDFDSYNKYFRLDLGKKIKQLSKGMQMRLSIMLNISTNPEILILDEPTSGLDAIAKKDLLSLLISQVEDKDMTIIISSHHIMELEKICDEVVIINKGKIKYKSNIIDIKENIKKLQVVFEENRDRELRELRYILNIEKIGSIYYLVVENYTEQIMEDFKKLGASLVENVGISLEEIFIYTSSIESRSRGEFNE